MTPGETSSDPNRAAQRAGRIVLLSVLALLGLVAVLALGWSGAFAGDDAKPVAVPRAVLVHPPAGATGPTGAASTPDCLDPQTGLPGPCPNDGPVMAAMGATNIPVDDIDRQPRPFKQASTGTVWLPIVPAGCPQNTAADAGADERYEAACPPEFAWYDQANPARVLHADGTVSQAGTPDPASAAAQLVLWHADLEAASLWAKCKAANPKDAALAEAYWTTPTSPAPTVKAACVKQFVDASQAYHYSTGDHP